MFLDIEESPNKEGYYLRIREWIKDGSKRVRKTLRNIGFVKNDDDETIEKWKEFVQVMNEIVEKHKEILEEISEENDDGSRKSINLGCCFIEQVLAIYNIREILADYQRNHDFNYQLYQDVIFLVEASVLNPSSIEDAVNNQNTNYKFYNIKLWDAYRSLDRIDENKEKILNHVAKTSLNLFADSILVFYIDGSNIFTYGQEDEDGLRRKGVSKENRNLPIVGIQLVTTHSGFPITYLSHAGNRHDSSQFIPTMTNVLEVVGPRRILTCGDSGYNSGTNNFYMAGQNLNNHFNNGYLFSQSANKIGENERNWILDKDGWFNGNGDPIDPNDEDFEEIGFRYKERNISRKDQIWIQDHSRKIPVETNLKQVVYYNEVYKEAREKAIEKKVERAYEISDDPEREIERDLKKRTNSYSNFKSLDAEATVNTQKVKEDLDMAGYLLLETSERDLSPMTLLHLYNDKFWIEWLFRILKSDLNLRPFYLRLDEHIEAFILIRFLALVVVRVLQHILGYEYSPKKIIKSLANFNCIPYKHKFVIHGQDEVIKKLEDFFEFHFKGEMTKKELDSIFSYKNFSNFWDYRFCEIFSNPPGLKLTEAEIEELIRNSRLSSSR